MFALISLTILFSYTAYYLSRVGLLPSHSDSYLALGKQGWMFHASLFLSAFLLMISLLEITPWLAYSFTWWILAAVCALGIVFYALNRKFKKPVLFLEYWVFSYPYAILLILKIM